MTRGALAVDEDDFVRDAFGGVERVLWKSLVVMKTPLVACFPRQRTDETLDPLAPHDALPALGLDVDDVEPEAVFA